MISNIFKLEIDTSPLLMLTKFEIIVEKSNVRVEIWEKVRCTNVHNLKKRSLWAHAQPKGIAFTNEWVTSK